MSMIVGECPICFEEMKPGATGGLRPTILHTVTTSNISHIFHHACIYEWFKENPSCPLCRGIDEIFSPKNQGVVVDEQLKEIERFDTAALIAESKRRKKIMNILQKIGIGTVALIGLAATATLVLACIIPSPVAIALAVILPFLFLISFFAIIIMRVLSREHAERSTFQILLNTAWTCPHVILACVFLIAATFIAISIFRALFHPSSHANNLNLDHPPIEGNVPLNLDHIN